MRHSESLSLRPSPVINDPGCGQWNARWSHAALADGRAPCCVCLENVRSGIDQRLLPTYYPFRKVTPDVRYRAGFR